MPQPLALQETAVLTETAAAQAKKSGRMVVQLISPGWGSSGYYSPQVLEAAAASNVIPVGTHMYADHPTETERLERPVRSIKDLISVTESNARLATASDVAAGAEIGALVAEVKVVGPYREVIEDLAGAIGVSILGDASDISMGEAEGRSGRIIEGLSHVASVDWVTRAGRGGKTLQVLESARAQVPEPAPVEEAAPGCTLDELVAMMTDLGILEAGGAAAHPGATERLMAYWAEGEGAAKIKWGVAGDFNRCVEHLGKYVADPKGLCSNLHVRATGARPGHAASESVPVSPAGSSTTESEEDTMPNIEESELARLREDAGRVTALEERATTAERDRDTAVVERDQARHELAERDRRDRAGEIVAERAGEHQVTFTALEHRGLLADLPLTESGDLDEAAFTTTVNEAATTAAAARGAGSVSGFGGQPAGDPSLEEALKALDESANRTFDANLQEA